ncbi:Outer membrane protein A precursor [Nitrincola lacisaponensis]|uniref:Outer membrane protein A n=1 Tax=Nitrincola lacisaponensis TaxID=267850 RepID=A0A063Y6T6_9GAMM|nr:OmpA family protein [Nitrincola lacisaponensis]KDE40850.1 Outer membrane protein A precursor [Nitrincola lacisaponensis]
MKKIAIAAGLAMTLGFSAAQAAVPGYAANSSDTVWRTSFGECWQTSSWNASKAVPGCAGYVAQAEAAPAPAPAPAPEVAELERKFALYFDFDSTRVGDISTIVNHIGSLASVESIKLTGHADRIGNVAYNDRLSQRRADAVAAALANAGVDRSLMSTSSMGSRSPVANCSGRGAELIACLRPDRRVDVEIIGTRRAQ